MSKSAQFLLQFNTFVQDNFLSEEGLLIGVYRFYMSRSNDAQFKEKITKALEDAGQHGSTINFLNLLQIFVYLIEIDPENFKNKETLFNHGMNYLRSANSTEDAEFLTNSLGKLISTQQFSVLIKNIQHFRDFNSANSNEAHVSLGLMESKIRWEIEKKKFFLVVKEGPDIIKQLLSGFKEFFHNNAPFQEKKMKILKYFLSYHLQHTDYLDQQNQSSLNHRSRRQQRDTITREVHYFVQKSQNISLKLELVTLCLKLFGIYDASSLARVLKSNVCHFYNQSYIEVINTILDIPQQVMVMTKEMSRDILINISDSILKVDRGNPSQAFQIVRGMCDLMISISKFYLIDFTKNITKKFSQYSLQAYHQIFLSSLLLIYDFKMSDSFLSSITACQKIIYIQNKQEEQYYRFLKFFGLESMGINQLRMGPERMEQIFWELHTLRISTLVNFDWIFEAHLFKGILLNLIRYVLSNIYPDECTEIAVKIIRSIMQVSLIKKVSQYDDQYCRNELDDINLSEVIQFVNSILIDKIVNYPTNNSLSNFFKILKTLKQNSQMKCLSDFALFVQIAQLIGIISTDGKRTGKEFAELSIELMRASMPQEKVKTDEINLNHILDMFSYFIKLQLNRRYLQIYIQIVFICLKREALRKEIMNHELFHFMDRQKFSFFGEYQGQRIKITHYMLENDYLDQDIVSNCWKYLKQAICRADSEFCLFLARIFNYFIGQMNFNAQSAQMEQYATFKREQIEHTVNFLGQINRRLKGTIIAKEAINYLQVLKAFQIYLLSSVNNYKKSNEPTEELFQRVKNVSIQLLNSLHERKWTEHLKRKDEQGQIFRDTWEITYITQLLLVETSLKPASAQNNFYRKQDKKIVEMYLWTQKELGKRKGNKNRIFHLRAMLLSKTVSLANTIDVSNIF